MTSNIVLWTIPSSYYTHQMVMGNLPYARRLNGQFMEIIHVGLAGKGTYKKREFEHSLHNRHYPADSEAYVTLYLYNDSNDVEIKRVIDQEEGPGVLYVDGNQVNDLSALGVSGEVRHPLILQHGIRDFVFAKPAERFSLISAQLGMGALNALQASIQNASRSFKTKPEDISKGQTLRADLIELCSTVPDMSPIKDELVRWSRLFEQ